MGPILSCKFLGYAGNERNLIGWFRRFGTKEHWLFTRKIKTPDWCISDTNPGGVTLSSRNRIKIEGGRIVPFSAPLLKYVIALLSSLSTPSPLKYILPINRNIILKIKALIYLHSLRDFMVITLVKFLNYISTFFLWRSAPD